MSINKISHIVDFTRVHAFDALVATCVILISKQKPQDYVSISSVGDDFIHFRSLNEYVGTHSVTVESKKLHASIWQLEDSRELAIKAKIESGCQKLHEVDGTCIYRGVTTGCNDAFVVNSNFRSSLLKSDPGSREIIKPLLQGRNIRKWFYQQSSEFLLFIPWHFPLHDDIKIIGASQKAESEFKKRFPLIYKYLLSFKKQLESRNKEETGKRYEWYALQRCAASYYPRFEEDKIVWGLTADKWAFAYDDKGHYLPSNGYILTSSQVPIKLLLAVLNSRLMEYYFKFIGIMTAGGAFTLKHETIAEFPIKNVPNTKQNFLMNLVEQILFTTKDEDYLSNPAKQAKVKGLERQIDQMVYELYGLTAEEIEVVEYAREDSL